MKNIFSKIKDSVVKAFRNPKKLIPTFILAVIWIAIPIIANFIPKANTPFLKFVSIITYANGGVNCGIIGLIGGAFGKAIFAAIINGLVISLCAKQNPFKGVIKKIVSIFKDAKHKVNPLLIGSGIGLILYFIFNISASTANIAIAIAAIFATLSAITKQNGLAFAGAFYIAKKLSKGKAPSRLQVSKVLLGLTAGFALALPMTYASSPLLILLLGIVLLIAGNLNFKKAKQVAMVLMMIFCLPITFGEILAAEMPNGFVNPATIEGLNFGPIYNYDPADEGYSDPAKLDGVYLIPKNIITYSFDINFPKQFKGRHLIGIGEDPITFNTENIKVMRGENNGEYKVSGSRSFTASDKLKGGSYSLEYTYEFTMKNIKMEKQSIIADYEGTEHIKWWSDDPEYPADERTVKISGRSDDDECRWHTGGKGFELELKTPKADIDDEKGLSMVFEIAGVKTNGKAAGIVTKPNKDNKPISNEHSDLDKHDAILVGGTIITTLAGIVGGAVASGTSSATGSILNNFEFSEDDNFGDNVEKDTDGDIYVKDSTGKKTLYKSNGDGTYKNMTTGDSYTQAEIKEHADYVSRNSQYFKNVNDKKEQSIEEQRTDNLKVSELGKEVDKKVKEQEIQRQKEEAHEEYKEKVAQKYGTTDEKEIKKEILKDRNEEYEKQGEALAKADMSEGYENAAKNVETAADVIVSVAGELDATGVGSIVKDGYVATKAVLVNTTQVVTGEKSIGGAIASAATDASVGIAQNHSTSATAKLLTNSSGDAIKTAIDGYAKGLSEEEIKANAKSAAASGAINATIDVGFDKAAGKAIKGMKNADKKVGKIFKKTVTKETATKAGKSAANDIVKNKINGGGEK